MFQDSIPIARFFRPSRKMDCKFDKDSYKESIGEITTSYEPFYDAISNGLPRSGEQHLGEGTEKTNCQKEYAYEAAVMVF